MIRTLSPTLVLFAAGIAAAEESKPEGDEEMTDMEFLEYLGSWDGADAEWELFEAAQTTSELEKHDVDVDADDEQEEVEDSES